MADDPTTPPTDDDAQATGDAAATDETTKLPAGDAAGTEPAEPVTEPTTELPASEAAARPAAEAAAPRAERPTATPVAVAAERPARWNPDRRSVLVTLVAVAALAGSFGLGWAAGAANEDDDGDRRGGTRMERFERGGGGPQGERGGMRDGGPGMRGERPGAGPGSSGESGERPDGFDQGFDGPRGRGDDSARGPAGAGIRGGVVGTITKVDGDTLTLDAIGPEGGGSTTVEIDDDVEVIVRGSGDRASGSRDDLEEGVMIAAHGDGDQDEDDDAIDADRIVVLRPAQ